MAEVWLGTTRIAICGFIHEVKMAFELNNLSTENGFPEDLSFADKIFFFGQSLSFPDMSDDDKIFLLQEGCKWEKENKDLAQRNPYLNPGQVLDKLTEHGR